MNTTVELTKKAGNTSDPVKNYVWNTDIDDKTRPLLDVMTEFRRENQDRDGLERRSELNDRFTMIFVGVTAIILIGIFTGFYVDNSGFSFLAEANFWIALIGGLFIYLVTGGFIFGGLIAFLFAELLPKSFLESKEDRAHVIRNEFRDKVLYPALVDEIKGYLEGNYNISINEGDCKNILNSNSYEGLNTPVTVVKDGKHMNASVFIRHGKMLLMTRATSNGSSVEI